MRKGPETDKAADQAFNRGLETRCGKDCPDRILLGRATETNLQHYPEMSVIGLRGRDDPNSVSRILCRPSPEV